MRRSALWILLALAACETKTAPTPGGGAAPQAPGALVTPGTTPAPVVSDAQAAPPDADLATASGEQIYGALCAPCHGKELEGYSADNAPSLKTQSFLESATDEFLERSIVTGRPGTSMAAYGQKLGGPLDDAGVDRLVGFIRQKGGVAARPDLPAVPKGDPAAAAGIYMKQCALCHGDRSTRRDSIHLANMMWQSQATDPFIKHAIVNGRLGTKMAAFGGVLTDQNINDLVAYIRTFGPQGAAAMTPPVAPTLAPPTGKEPLVIHPKGKDPTWTLREDKYVGVDQVAAAYKAGAKMIIVDARPASDWMRARITGAVSIPHHDLKRLPEIPKDTWVVAYCACPHHLSGIVVDELRKRGHVKSAVLDEGVNVWHRKGYPMTVAEGVQPPAAEDHSGHNHGHDHSGHGHGVIQ